MALGICYETEAVRALEFFTSARLVYTAFIPPLDERRDFPIIRTIIDSLSEQYGGSSSVG